MAAQPVQVLPLQLSMTDVIANSDKNRQRHCRHKFMPVKIFDHEHDEVYFDEVCNRCGHIRYFSF